MMMSMDYLISKLLTLLFAGVLFNTYIFQLSLFLEREGVYCLRPRWARLHTTCHAKNQLFCRPSGHTAIICDEIWITESGTMVLIFNLDEETFSYDQDLKR